MTWLQRLWRRKRLETELEKELRFHIDQHSADLIAQGHNPNDARRQARLELGGPEQLKEDLRDARGTRWLEDLGRDVRYALRTLRQQPAFAAVALVTLALGIGATTVMFTVIDGVMLKPLPYPEPDRLFQIDEKTDYSTHWGDIWGFSYPNFIDCQKAAPSLLMAAHRFGGGTVVSESGQAEYVQGRQVSAGLFNVIGLPMFRGRAFLPEEDRAGAAPVAIVTYEFWQRMMAGSGPGIGSSIIFEGKPYTIAGILPPGFRIDGGQWDIFTLLGQNPSPSMQNRDAHPLAVWARLAPGATIEAAQRELGLTGRHLAQEYPASNKGRTFVAKPLRVDVSDVQSTLWMLLGAVSLILLIACANIASLLLARAVSRERELAMRIALGASRGRLIRQCLTESGVLGLTGGLLGVLLAAVGIRPFLTFWPGSLPRAESVQLDWRVLLFAAAASLLSGLIFGLAPSLRAPVRDLEQALRAGGRTVGAGVSSGLHNGFVIVQLALAVVLLVSSGMLGRTLLRLATVDPGVNVHNVLTARTALSPATLANPDRIRSAWADILERARRVPGIEAAAIIDIVPMRDGNNQIVYRTSAVAVPDIQQPIVLATSVTADYLKVAGARLIAGRFFDEHDRKNSEPVVVVDEVMAHQAFPGENPIGKHIWISLGPDPARVVGVVPHVRYWGLAGDDRASVRAQLYYPFAQVPDPLQARWSQLMSIAVRTSIPPASVLEPLRKELRGATGDQVLYEVNTLEDLAQSSIARQRFLMLLFGIFAGLALLLASIGIYGVMAYLTSQRIPEIGVRLALGATAGEILQLVLGQSVRVIFAGIVIGGLAAFAAGRLLERLVEGMRPAEPSTFAAMVAVLVFAALFASFVPARRASRIDPVKSLRQE